ncbi:hypothetical protein D3C76_789810 [compost metagenome]
MLTTRHVGVLPTVSGPCGQGTRQRALPRAVQQRSPQGGQSSIVEARGKAMPVGVLPQAVELRLRRHPGRRICGLGAQYRVGQLLEQGPDRDQWWWRRRAGLPATGCWLEHQGQGLLHCPKHSCRLPGAAQLPVFANGTEQQLHRRALAALLQWRQRLFLHALQALAQGRRHVPAQVKRGVLTSPRQQVAGLQGRR